MEGNGWSKNEMYVLNELKRLSDKVEKLDEKLDFVHLSISTDITGLKIRAGWIGGVVSFLVSLGAILAKTFLGG